MFSYGAFLRRLASWFFLNHHCWFPVRTAQEVAFSLARRGNWTRSKCGQETITTHLLHIPGDLSGEFWKGKEEGVIVNSNSFCCLPATGLFTGGFPLAFSYITLPPPPLFMGIWGRFSPMSKESQLGSNSPSSVFSIHGLV